MVILQAGIFQWGTMNVGSGMPSELAETRFAKGLLDTSPSMLCPLGGGTFTRLRGMSGEIPNLANHRRFLLLAGDLASMRRIRNKDLDTRQATTRSVRTADNIQEQRQAIQRRDWYALQALHARMIEDGSLGEILSGFHGLPYADIQDIIPDLQNKPLRFQFQRDAQRIQQLDRRLRQAQASLGNQLQSWVMLQTGVPNNAPQLALQQAQQRLAVL